MDAQISNSAGAAACALGGIVRRALFVCFLATLTTVGGCNSTTLFQSNFDTTNFDQPPAPKQAVGTAEVSGEPNVVVVAEAPPNAAPPAKWLRIVRRTFSSPESSFEARLVQQQGDGTYTFAATLFIPEVGIRPATILFEQLSQATDPPVAFLRLDFMEGGVRIDNNNNTSFGTFPLDHVFLVQVTLNINQTKPSAHIILSGAGTSFNAERDITLPSRTVPLQFGAVRFLVGSPGLGALFVTNAVVTR